MSLKLKGVTVGEFCKAGNLDPWYVDISTQERIYLNPESSILSPELDTRSAKFAEDYAGIVIRCYWCGKPSGVDTVGLRLDIDKTWHPSCEKCVDEIDEANANNEAARKGRMK